MKFVIDASVAIKWYIPEIYEQEALSLVIAKHRFHVPELILPEFINTIWLIVRRGALTKSQGEQIVEDFVKRRWTIHSQNSVIKTAYLGAVSSGQTVYDWTYLALAVSLSCEMVTADQKFYKALEKTPLKSNLKWIGDV